MRILLLAGEESGLIYADELRRRLSDCEIRGYADYGFRTADLAVMGFWPVLRRIFYFLGVARTMKRAIREWRPDVVATVDYPGLNLALARYAKDRGVPAVHLVCPQVWAWRRGRIPKVAAALTKLLCFFPFEPALFAGTGLDAKFIGHPLADAFSEAAVAAGETAGAAGGETETLALLPGSRLGEIRRILPRMLLAAARLENGARVRLEIPAANPRAETLIRRLLADAPAGLPPVEVRPGGARGLLRRADCAVVASGTATLEAALARCPTVLVYAVSAPLAWFARRVIRGVRHVGLANVVWEKAGGVGEAPMPELLQEAFTPEATAAILNGWRRSAAARAAAVRRLDGAMALLASDGGAMDRAAAEIRASGAAARR